MLWARDSDLDDAGSFDVLRDDDRVKLFSLMSDVGGAIYVPALSVPLVPLCCE